MAVSGWFHRKRSLREFPASAPTGADSLGTARRRRLPGVTTAVGIALTLSVAQQTTAQDGVPRFVHGVGVPGAGVWEIPCWGAEPIRFGLDAGRTSEEHVTAWVLNCSGGVTLWTFQGGGNPRVVQNLPPSQPRRPGRPAGTPGQNPPPQPRRQVGPAAA